MTETKLPLHLPDAGPAADELIAVHFFGWSWPADRCPVCGFCDCRYNPEIPQKCSVRPIPVPTARAVSISPYTHCDTTALLLVERLRLSGWMVSFTFLPDGLPILMGNDATSAPEVHAKVKCELSDGLYLVEREGKLERFRNPQFGFADDVALAVARAAWKTVSIS